MKKLILVTSPPACGKTYVSQKLAEALTHVVYLDKDTLIPLSKQIFSVAHQEYNRSSDFFNQYIRDFEYETIVALALEALKRRPHRAHQRPVHPGDSGTRPTLPV